MSLSDHPAGATADNLHIGIVRSASAFWYNPVNVLAGVFDIASFTMHAVLRVDLQTRVFALFLANYFIDTSRAIALRGLIIFGQIDINWHG